MIQRREKVMIQDLIYIHTQAKFLYENNIDIY